MPEPLVRCLLACCLTVMLSAAQPVFSAPGCVAEEGGIGGTGVVAEGGMGGTGAIDGGIGGTGMLAEGGIGGTGIVGAISGFGSICVNGLEVFFEETTPVSINGLASDARSLALGQVVAVYAEHAAQGLAARGISVLHALEGPVTAIDAGKGILEVMGRTVRLGSDTTFGGTEGLAGVERGAAVQVSGYWNHQHEVVATRIGLAENRNVASALGRISIAGGRRTLDGLPLTGAPDREGEVLVRGTWNGAALVVAEMLPGPAPLLLGRAERMVVEGVVQRTSGEHLVIGGFEVLAGGAQIAGGTRVELAEGRKVRIIGRPEGPGLMRAERVELRRAAALAVRGSVGHKGTMESGTRNGRGAMSEMPGMVERLSAPGRAERMERMERIDRPERMEPLPGMERMDHRHSMDMERPGGK